VLVRLLKVPVTQNNDDLLKVFSATFDLMHSFLLGNSRKNKVYFLQYLHFFQRQFDAKVCEVYTDIYVFCLAFNC